MKRENNALSFLHTISIILKQQKKFKNENNLLLLNLTMYK